MHGETIVIAVMPPNLEVAEVETDAVEIDETTEAEIAEVVAVDTVAAVE